VHAQLFVQCVNQEWDVILLELCRVIEFFIALLVALGAPFAALL